MRDQRCCSFFFVSDRTAVLLLWTVFAVGCVLGAVGAASIGDTALLRLQESLQAYLSAARAGMLSRSFGSCLLELFPWTVAANVAAVFISCSVTLPLLLGLRGALLGYLAAVLLRLNGWPQGILCFGAVCGVKNVVLLFAITAVTVPNFTRALQRTRLRGGKRIYVIERIYLCSVAVSLGITLLGAAADLYVTPVLTAMLAQ
ncbi:MAG: hypothetical protein IKU55_04375 [Clostridia bacterium]|nr:hypothetical protein [Clostridia bacterium]